MDTIFDLTPILRIQFESNKGVLKKPKNGVVECLIFLDTEPNLGEENPKNWKSESVSSDRNKGVKPGNVLEDPNTIKKY